MNRPSRKKPIHGIQFGQNSPPIVFDTICTKNRIPWLANPIVHQQLRQVWSEATAWLVGRYVIMPNHIHLFATPAKPFVEYENWVRFWKSRFTRLHGNPDHRWQSDHWETRIRNPAGYDEKWEYVSRNPVRHGLAGNPDEWEYQGELFEIRWEEA